MLEVTIKFQKAFERFEEEDENFLAYFTEVENGKQVVGPPLYEDWDNARVFVKFLKTFYDVTKRLSASLHITANLFYHDICSIHLQLIEHSSSTESLTSNMALGMLTKFEKYWGDETTINVMLLIAVVLDPRYKLVYLKYMFRMVYNAVTANNLEKKVTETLQRLLGFYSKEVVGDTSQDSGVGLMVSDKGDLEGNSLLLGFLRQKEIIEKNDLERYLAEDNVSPLKKDFDILEWWKENQNKYKTLSQIARDVLAVQVSTVASESAFSTSGRILDPFRSSLSPEMVEALICTQNWLRSSHEGIVVKEYIEGAEEQLV